MLLTNPINTSTPQLPQFLYVSRQAPSGWRLTSSLLATRLSPKPCFLDQIALFWCVYIQLRVTKPKFLQYVQTNITPALQQRRLIDFLSVVASLIENLVLNKAYMYKSWRCIVVPTSNVKSSKNNKILITCASDAKTVFVEIFSNMLLIIVLNTYV